MQKPSFLASTSRRDIMRFALAPQFGPAMRSIGEVFGHFVLLFAHIFRSAGLLPANHPVLRGEQLNLDGFARILIDGSANVKLDWRAVPQLGVYYAVLGFVACTLLWVFGMLADALIGAAYAQSLFEAENDRGAEWVRSMFTLAGAEESDLQPLAQALGPMLSVYSQGALVLGGIIIGWTLLSVVTETAHHGVVLGKSHNEIWAPVRLIFALAILVPINNGFNAGQAMVVQFAQWGSGLATNTWSVFVEELTTSTPVVQSVPTPALREVVRRATLLEVCAQSINMANISAKAPPPIVMAGPIQRWETTDAASQGRPADYHFYLYDRQDGIRAAEDNAGDGEGSFFGFMRWVDRALNFNDKYPSVFSWETCGNIRFSASSEAGDQQVLGLRHQLLAAQEAAFLEVLPQIREVAKHMALQVFPNPQEQFGVEPRKPTGTDIDIIVVRYEQAVQEAIAAAITQAQANARTQAMDRIDEMGWVAGAAWFFEMAKWNGQVVSASKAIPEIQLRRDTYGGLTEGFDRLASWWRGDNTQSKTDIDYMVPAVESADKFFEKYDRQHALMVAANTASIPAAQDEGIFSRLTSYLQIRSALANFAESENGPLMRMVQLGQDLMFVTKTGLIGAGITGVLNTTVGLLIGAISLAVYGAATALAIVLPVLPAIRFIFGIVSWLLSIFEAVVAVPVIALAHLRTDGSGLMGPLAQTGYFLLLQIFTRPILMIFGLIGGLMIFNIGMAALNETFLFAVESVNHGGTGDFLTSLSYVFVYTGVAYSLANMCFKAIDMVPDQVLRWVNMGGLSSVSDTEAASRAAQAGAGKESELAREGISAIGSMRRR